MTDPHAIPPHSVEAEMVTLGSMIVAGLNDKALFARMMEHLDPQDFFLPKHIAIFTAMRRELARSGGIDAHRLTEALRSSGELEGCGGSEYLVELAECVPSHLEGPHYVRIVKGHSRVRQVLRIAGEAEDRCYLPDPDPDQIAESMVGDLGKVMSRCDNVGHEQAGVVVERYVQQMQQREKEGPQQLGFWQIVVFAWLCNGAMHFGMADLSIFRFARKPSSGWAPAIGMFLGHYMAWIAAALLLAAQIKLVQDHSADPGRLAWRALGWTGIICVVIAGWTTANPTIYRAGLAFQGVLPRRSRAAMTLLAGAVATLAGAFPNLSAQLLGFVRTYGTVLGPMGAVIFVDYYLMRKFGLNDEYADRNGSSVNFAVLAAWLLPVSVGLYLIFWQGLFAAYAVVPAWIACGIIYLVLSKLTQKNATSSAAS